MKDTVLRARRRCIPAQSTRVTRTGIEKDAECTRMGVSAVIYAETAIKHGNTSSSAVATKHGNTQTDCPTEDD